jgi:hypothetical protein
MHDQRVITPDLIKVMQGLAARHQIVLGHHLEPVDTRTLIDNGLVMVGAQTGPEAEKRPFGLLAHLGNQRLSVLRP